MRQTETLFLFLAAGFALVTIAAFHSGAFTLDLDSARHALLAMVLAFAAAMLLLSVPAPWRQISRVTPGEGASMFIGAIFLIAWVMGPPVPRHAYALENPAMQAGELPERVYGIRHPAPIVPTLN